MSNNRTEFQRDQITRKSVFVRNKRTAPAPPSGATDEIDGGRMSVTTPKISLETLGIQQGVRGTSIKTNSSGSNKVATENKINLCKTKYNMTTERPAVSSVRRGIEKWDNLSQDNKLHIQEHDTHNAIRTNTALSTPEDDTSMNMLLQLEKHINKMEFDTRVTSKNEPKEVTQPMMRKPVQYTGMESLLNTGVSNVATEGGIGYLEIRSNNEDDEADVGNFKRSTDVRQSIGIGTGDRKPPSGVKQSQPVQRTSSDTNQMKQLAMAKRNEAGKDMKKVSPSPPPRSTSRTNSPSSKVRSQLKDDKYRPKDVKKYVEEHMKSRKVNRKFNNDFGEYIANND